MTSTTTVTSKLLSLLLYVLLPAAKAESEWNQTALLRDAMGDKSHLYGFAVAIEDGVLVVGAEWNPIAGFNAGAVFIYGLVGGEWSEQAMLTASDATEYGRFGYSVAIYSGTVAVGALISSKVYVYVQEEDGSWTEQTKLVASDVFGYSGFGNEVRLNESGLFVGALIVDAGSVYVFRELAGGEWTEQAKLVPSDGTSRDWFGLAFAVQGDWLFVGAPRDDDAGVDSGSTYVFRQVGGGWTEQAKLTASNGLTNNQFGWSMAIDDERLAIGTLNADTAYLFHLVAGSWTEQARLIGSDGYPVPGRRFGNSVGLSDGIVLVGESDNGYSGAAFLFAFVAGSWTMQAKLVASDRLDYLNLGFGKAVALQNGRAVVSAPSHTRDRGSVYVFDEIRGTCKSWLTRCDTWDECCTGFCWWGRCRLFGFPHP